MKKLISKIIVSLLGFIYTSCEENNHSNMHAEYGCPYAEYKISGIVTDAGINPVKNIKIIFNTDRDIETFSDDNGSWSIESRAFPCFECSITATDIDGPDNGGEFADKTVELNLTQVEEGSDWYEGSYEQENIEIKLEMKN